MADASVEVCASAALLKENQQTSWPLVHKQTIPTEQLPLVGQF
jgi:hypothetical protein